MNQRPHLHRLIGPCAAFALIATASAFQGPPTTIDDRELGLSVREMVVGNRASPSGEALITISGRPGQLYLLLANIGLDVDDDTAALPGALGRRSVNPNFVADAAYFSVRNGTFGVIPLSGIQEMDLMNPLPNFVGAGLPFFELQAITLRPGGVLEWSNGQTRFMLGAPPPPVGWTDGGDLPASEGTAYSDIEQGDVDGDGDSDTVGVSAAGLDLWLMDGGSFVEVPGALLFAGLFEPVSAELADLDNDADLDLVVTGFAPGLFGAFLRTFINQGYTDSGDWLGYEEEFLPVFDFPIGTCAGADVEVADLDGDGFRDIFVACALDPTFGQQNRIFFYNPEDGAFLDGTGASLPEISDDTEDCEIYDYDQDGDLDVVLANFDGSFPASPFGEGGDYILQNQGGAQGGVEGLFLAPFGIIPVVADESLDVVVGNVDGEESPDLYFSNWAASPTPGAFTMPPVAVPDRLLTFDPAIGAYVDMSILLPDQGEGDATFSTDAEMVDVDFDGALDILVALGTLGGVAPVTPMPVAGLSTGVDYMINTGGPWARVLIDDGATEDLDLRDIEHGDWRQSILPVGLPPIGTAYYFDKDIGCASVGPMGGQVSTLERD